MLLGNGFSQACRNDIFNYQNLFQQANFGARDENIRGISDSFDTYDFEKIIRTLESAQTICTAYNIDLLIIDQISVELEQLKNSLIQVISQTHPTRSSSIDEQHRSDFYQYFW
ncbi:DUF4917 family protein [Gilliamella sp. B14384G12]|uniref:DUF4917 family protein n=1 Tax=Gilliamella sp. B14384G12 TaxID=2750956 RepID=UPI00351C68EF